MYARGHGYTPPWKNASTILKIFTYSNTTLLSPSRHAKTPTYSEPEWSLTETTLPKTCFKKSAGDLLTLDIWMKL